FEKIRPREVWDFAMASLAMGVQLRAERLSLQEILDRVLAVRLACNAAEDHARVLDGIALHLHTHRERRHREVPHFSRTDLFERGLEAGLRRRDRHLG